MEQKYIDLAKRILDGLDIKTNGDFIKDTKHLKS